MTVLLLILGTVFFGIFYFQEKETGFDRLATQQIQAFVLLSLFYQFSHCVVNHMPMQIPNAKYGFVTLGRILTLTFYVVLLDR